MDALAWQAALVNEPVEDAVAACTTMLLSADALLVELLGPRLARRLCQAVRQARGAPRAPR